jgi:hypothetical protein
LLREHDNDDDDDDGVCVWRGGGFMCEIKWDSKMEGIIYVKVWSLGNVNQHATANITLAV